MDKIFGNATSAPYPVKNYKTDIERAVRLVKSCRDSDARRNFYECTTCLDFVGPACSQLGLTRSKLHDVSNIAEPLPLSSVTNRLLFELFKFCDDESSGYTYLFELFQHIQPEIYSAFTKTMLKTRVITLKKQYQKLNKDCSRNENAEMFLN